MLKAGFIGAGIGFLLGIVISLVAVYLNPVVALLLGLGVGFLAAVWKRPMSFEAGVGQGVIAGGMAALGNLIGHMIGAIIYGLLKLGFEDKTLGGGIYITAWYYWPCWGGVNCLCAVMDVAIVAGLGAVGGLLGYWLVGTGQS
jgi:hypothetical protein